MKLKYSVLALVLLGVLLAGCVVCPTNKSQQSSDSPMRPIDDALAKGPVFVEFGATWCTWCTKEEPIIEELKADYPGITFLHVDTDENGSLADAFYVNGIPQMNLIVQKYDNGSYLYVDAYGKTTTGRKASAIVGYHEKAELVPLLNAASGIR